MKTNKNVIICALLVLAMLLCVGAVSASDSSNETMTTVNTDNNAVSDDSQNSLSESTTYGSSSNAKDQTNDAKTSSKIDDAESAISVANDDNLNDESTIDNPQDKLAKKDSEKMNEKSSNTVTKDTFFNYFDETGTLRNNVTFNELIFNGNFSGVGVNYITIDKSIIFTGDNAVFDGTSFIINSDNVIVDGFTVTQSSDVSAFTVYGVSNVTLSNNRIDFVALEGYNSYAIYAGLVDNFNIINNIIFYVGNTDGTVVNNGIRIEGDDDEDNPTPATNITVSGNTFGIQMPSVDMVYDWDTGESTVMNDAIVFYYCEGLEFVNNIVNVEYNNVTTAYGWDSLYAVSVRSDAFSFGEIQSKDVTIANNNINIDGHSCTYPIYVCADNFEIIGNIINSKSETYLAHGIDVDGPSANGTVIGNTIFAEAPLATYGIYSSSYYGSVENITYSNNNIETTGYASAGMELAECNPNIIGNTIKANGNYTYGIVTSIIDNGTIQGNKITSKGNNKGTTLTGDSLLPLTSMGINVKGKVGIEENTIETTGTAINVVSDSAATLINNNIISDNSAIEELNKEIAENEKQMDNLTNQTEKLTNEVSNLTDENKQLATQKDDATKALAAKDKEATQLTVDKTNLQNQVNTLNSQLTSAQNSNTEASAKISKVKAASKVKKSKNFKITVTLSSTKVNGKYVYVIFNGKSYKAKAKNGVAKITIKKSALKKLGGKTVKYSVVYDQSLKNKSVKVKK